MDSLPIALATALLAIPLAFVTVWIMRGMAKLHALLAVELLGRYEGAPQRAGRNPRILVIRGAFLRQLRGVCMTPAIRAHVRAPDEEERWPLA